jgi:hypothetical protein
LEICDGQNFRGHNHFSGGSADRQHGLMLMRRLAKVAIAQSLLDNNGP